MVVESRKPAAAPSPLALTRIYAWFSALVNDDTETLEALLAHGVEIDVLHPLRHTTALMEATRRGNAAMVEWLLHRGAAPAFLCGIPLGTPLHCSLRRQYWGIADLLSHTMQSAAVLDGYGCTPLHVLCMEAQHAAQPGAILALARTLIEKQCPLDALDHEGTTALHHCVINEGLELAELLLSHGANANAPIPDSWVSPLTIAALEKNMPMARLLMLYGADVQLKTREGSSPATIYPALAHL